MSKIKEIEKTKNSINIEQDIKNNGKKSISFLNHLREKQKEYIYKNHNNVFQELGTYLYSGVKTKLKIAQKYEDSNIIKILEKTRGKTLSEKLNLSMMIAIVSIIILFLIRKANIPFILLDVIISLIIPFLIDKKENFEKFFQMKENFSDPISQMLINRFNNASLNKEEIIKLKEILNEKEFIEAFGENVDNISLRYGDKALRKILEDVKYNYEKKNKEDKIKIIYYND